MDSLIVDYLISDPCPLQKVFGGHTGQHPSRTLAGRSSYDAACRELTPIGCGKGRSALDDVSRGFIHVFTLIDTSSLRRVHFDTVGGPHDENVGLADEEPAFDHSGNSVESCLEFGRVIDSSDVQIQNVVP